MDISKEQTTPMPHEHIVVQGTRVLHENELEAVSGGAIGSLALTPAIQKVRFAE
jgi:hypothetical protein